jgi:hypothetical protein
VRLYLRAVVLIVFVTALAIAVDPSQRGTSLRIALMALVVTGLVGLLQIGSRRLPATDRSPFDPAAPRPVRRPEPVELSRLASDLGLYQRGGGARLGTGTVDRIVRSIVRERLRRGHGLELGEDATADPQVAALLGPATTAVLTRRRDRDPPPVDAAALVRELEAL